MGRVRLGWNVTKAQPIHLSGLKFKARYFHGLEISPGPAHLQNIHTLLRKKMWDEARPLGIYRLGLSNQTIKLGPIESTHTRTGQSKLWGLPRWMAISEGSWWKTLIMDKSLLTALNLNDLSFNRLKWSFNLRVFWVSINNEWKIMDMQTVNISRSIVWAMDKHNERPKFGSWQWVHWQLCA